MSKVLKTIEIALRKDWLGVMEAVRSAHWEPAHHKYGGFISDNGFLVHRHTVNYYNVEQKIHILNIKIHHDLTHNNISGALNFLSSSEFETEMHNALNLVIIQYSEIPSYNIDAVYKSSNFNNQKPDYELNVKLIYRPSNTPILSGSALKKIVKITRDFMKN
jgi:hypothetical protein